MKKTILIIILGIFCGLSFSTQQEKASEHFYYYSGEKIFLKQKTNKILLSFAPNANTEQVRSLISSYTSLQPSADTRLDATSLY